MGNAERDYLAAIRERVVVFDGGMGATLEEFELTAEDYGGLKGKLPRGARVEPPGRDRGRPCLDDRGGRRGARDRHVPGQPDQARRVGPRRARAGDQQGGRRDRPQGRRAGPLRRGIDRADGVPPRLRRPHARRHQLRQARRGLRRAGRRPDRGRRGPADHRDPAGHPRDQGGDLRSARGLQAHGCDAADPGEPVPAEGVGNDAARHRRAGADDDARRARRRRARAQLLDRARRHAGRDPLPRRELPAAAALHPERGHSPPGARRRDDLPRGARAAGRDAGRVRRALRRRHRRRLLRNHP